MDLEDVYNHMLTESFDFSQYRRGRAVKLIIDLAAVEPERWKEHVPKDIPIVGTTGIILGKMEDDRGVHILVKFNRKSNPVSVSPDHIELQ